MIKPLTQNKLFDGDNLPITREKGMDCYVCLVDTLCVPILTIESITHGYAPLRSAFRQAERIQKVKWVTGAVQFVT